MLHTPAQQARFAALLLACGFVFWRGGRVERLAAVATLAAWLATPLLTDRDWLSPQYGVLAVDLGWLAALSALALRGGRYWPMPAAALALLNVLIHLAFVLDPRVWPWAFFYGDFVLSWMIVAVLVVGAWVEAPRTRPLTSRRREAGGPIVDRDA